MNRLARNSRAEKGILLFVLLLCAVALVLGLSIGFTKDDLSDDSISSDDKVGAVADDLAVEGVTEVELPRPVILDLDWTTAPFLMISSL